jgi:hypothetical protein
LLAIVAGENDTNVEVYNLTLNSWMQVWAGSLNSMEKQLLLLDNGTTFKVVSDKIVSVLLLNYQGFPSASVMEGPVPCTSYTDVNGLYVGKEFVFMASENPGASQGGSQKEEGAGAFYTILALESGTVTVTSESGQVVWQGSLGANAFKYLVLMPFTVYKIESTGNIMVQSGAVPGLAGESFPCYPIPSADGGFVGEHFFAPSVLNPEWGWDPGMYYGFQISALETAHVTIYNLATQNVIETLTIPGGTAVVTQPASYAIRVDSDQPITMSLTHNGSIQETPTGNGDKYQAYPNGVMFIGIRPNQETMIYLPTEGHDEAYFFASKQTQLTIDGTAYTIPAGSSYPYSLPGTHTVESNSSVILQINFWPLTPENQGLWYGGAVIPCIETVDSSATVTLTPISGGGFPIMYVFAGVGAAVVVVLVVVGVLVMRRRGGKPS